MIDINLYLVFPLNFTIFLIKIDIKVTKTNEYVLIFEIFTHFNNFYFKDLFNNYQVNFHFKKNLFITIVRKNVKNITTVVILLINVKNFRYKILIKILSFKIYTLQ